MYSSCCSCNIYREKNRQAEIKELTSKGIIPHEEEMRNHPEKSLQGRTFLIGRVAALIHDVPSAKEIVESMVDDAAQIIQERAASIQISGKTKL